MNFVRVLQRERARLRQSAFNVIPIESSDDRITRLASVGSQTLRQPPCLMTAFSVREKSRAIPVELIETDAPVPVLTVTV